MARCVLGAAVVAALALSACSQSANKSDVADKAEAAPDDPAFHAKVVAYLADHPGVIQEGVNAYDAKQHRLRMARASAAIATRHPALETDPRDFVANPGGKITVVEFFDYRCPYCKAEHAALQSLIAEDKDIRFVFKEYPVIPDADGKLGVSQRAAEAALAAKRAGKYLQVHDALMATPQLDDATIAAILRQNGVDPALASQQDIDHLKDVHKLAGEIHVAGTPAFIVGDTMVDTSSMDRLAAAIQDARKTKG
jgi:protein-disulfide isomerase